MEPVSVKVNEKLIKPFNPVKLGFEFRGWHSDVEKQIVYDFNAPVTGDMTLYAKSIGGEGVLAGILKVGAAVDNKISMEVNTPVQNLKVRFYCDK